MSASLDSRFLNSIVLRGAMEKSGLNYVEVTIDRIEHHDVLKYENGQIDKDVYLLYFKASEKPLKLNNTNIKRIICQHGTLGKNWHGQKIKLVIEQDRRPDLGGIKGDCVRVKHESKNKPSPSETANRLKAIAGEEVADA